MENRSEKWRDVVGYEGLYQVSSMGRVRSLRRPIMLYNGGVYVKDGRILKAVSDTKYLFVLLYDEYGKRKCKHIHRIVAEAFIPCKNKEYVVNHKNEDKEDNRVTNLEWISQSENIKYGSAISRRAMKARNNPKFSLPVCQFTKNGDFVREYPSQSEAARQMGIKVCAIQNCVKGRSNSAGGYVWKCRQDAQKCPNFAF